MSQNEVLGPSGQGRVADDGLQGQGRARIVVAACYPWKLGERSGATGPGVDRQNDVGQGGGGRLSLARRDRVGTGRRRRKRVPDAARNAGLAGRQRRIPSCRRKGYVDGGGQMREGSRGWDHDRTGAEIISWRNAGRRGGSRRRCWRWTGCRGWAWSGCGRWSWCYPRAQGWRRCRRAAPPGQVVNLKLPMRVLQLKLPVVASTPGCTKKCSRPLDRWSSAL